MARRGFVALSAHYDNTLNLGLDKLTCAFTTSNATSLLGTACALPNVDCGKGIATWGHSQGALMAHAASQFEPRVRAVWATGYSGGSYPLSSNGLRVVNGDCGLRRFGRVPGGWGDYCPSQLASSAELFSLWGGEQ